MKARTDTEMAPSHAPSRTSQPQTPAKRAALTAPVLAVAALLALLAAPATQAKAACDPQTQTPAGFLLEPGNRMLFFGDSISRHFQNTRRVPYHYARLFQNILHNTYCEFSTFETWARGKGGKNYRHYYRLIPKFLRNEERRFGYTYKYVMTQDAGRAMPLENNFYREFVEQTINLARAQSPTSEFFLATTPKLDRFNARRGFVRRYDFQNDWLDHNIELEAIAADVNASIIPWADTACDLYERAPNISWTADGVHPQAQGHLMLALANLKFFGAELADLNLSDLAQFHTDLTPTVAGVIADWVYNPTGPCGS